MGTPATSQPNRYYRVRAALEALMAKRWLLPVVIVLGFALSLALLVGAGLFLRSLFNVSRAELGLKVDNVVTFGVSPELNGYTPVRSGRMLRLGEFTSPERAAHLARRLAAIGHRAEVVALY